MRVHELGTKVVSAMLVGKGLKRQCAVLLCKMFKSSAVCVLDILQKGLHRWSSLEKY